ncbi:OmpA family protein [bacterium]|nr:OmpA family protein [bacterium]
MSTGSYQKIIIPMLLLFTGVCTCCLRTHLERIPVSLRIQCVDVISSFRAECTSIAMDGRDVQIVGKVADIASIDSIESALSAIEGLRNIQTDFQLHEDVRKNLWIRTLSNREIYFGKDSSSPPVSSESLIDSLTDFLNRYPDMHLTIYGHSDTEGDSLYNMILSEKRADSVRAALNRKGCHDDRLTAVALGEQAADSLILSDSRARRVHFKFEETVP